MVHPYSSIDKITPGVMAIIIGNGPSKLSSNLDKAVGISHSANTLAKGMNPTNIAPATGK